MKRFKSLFQRVSARNFSTAYPEKVRPLEEVLILHKSSIFKGKWRVTPALPVPDHIKRPSYLKDGVYGLYEGGAIVHQESTIKSIKKSSFLTQRVERSCKNCSRNC